MALMSKPTHDPKLTRWWWRTLREWVYELVDPLWGAFRGENGDEITLANVTGINDVSASELAALDGLIATTSELNKLFGLTAEASELNKADRTQADGVAEASKNMVLDANKDILGKRYDISQSLLASVANRPHMKFDGVNDYIAVVDDADLDFGTGNGSIELLVYMPDVSVAPIFFTRYQNSSNNMRVSFDGSSFEAFYRTGGTYLHRALASWSPLANTWYHLVWTFENGSNNMLYINGEAQSLSIDIHTGGGLSLAADLEIAKYSSNYYGVIVASIRQFNRHLSPDEVKALASGAPVNWADKGADQTDQVTNGEDWTGAGGSTPPNGWNDTGPGTSIYIIRDNTPVENFGDNKALEFSASGGSKTLYQNVAQVDKRFRVSFVYRNLDGSSSSYVALGSSTNKAILQNTGISGDGILFEQDFMADGTDLMFFVGTGGTLQIDHVQVIQVGCVAQYQPAGITHAQWQDDSGNELHGSVNGAVPLNLPSNHVARYIKQGITGDTTLTDAVPAGYRIKSMVADVTGAGSGMILNVGTSAGGTDVVNGQDISANGLFDLTVAKNIFSLTAAQTLYVNDDGGTAWSGVNVDLYIEMERVK